MQISRQHDHSADFTCRNNIKNNMYRKDIYILGAPRAMGIFSTVTLWL